MTFDGVFMGLRPTQLDENRAEMIFERAKRGTWFLCFFNK